MRQGHNDTALSEFVTVIAGGQLFGLPIARVRDVFIPARLTRVPLAPPEIAGILNLRGRIVTAVDMRARLDLPASQDGAQPMAVGIDYRGESYGLLIDSVGEVLSLDPNDCRPNPVNLDARLARVSSGVFRLETELLVVLDIERVLDLGRRAIAA